MCIAAPQTLGCETRSSFTPTSCSVYLLRFFLREDALCGNNQNQRTWATVNVESVLSPSHVDVNGIVGTLGREHRTSRLTHQGLEVALHLNLTKPRSFGRIDVGHGSIERRRLTNQLAFFGQILLVVLVTPFFARRCSLREQPELRNPDHCKRITCSVPATYQHRWHRWKVGLGVSDVTSLQTGIGGCPSSETYEIPQLRR